MDQSKILQHLEQTISPLHFSQMQNEAVVILSSDSGSTRRQNPSPPAAQPVPSCDEQCRTTAINVYEKQELEIQNGRAHLLHFSHL